LSNELLFGKHPQKKIVGLEIDNQTCELFVQNDLGEVTSQVINNKFWLLTDKPHGKYIRLHGNLHYKFAQIFTDRQEFMKTKAQYRMKNIDFYQISNHKEALMAKLGITYFKELNFKDVSVLSFDIETTGLDLNDQSKVLLISNTFRDSNGKITRRLFSYDEHENIFEAWSLWVRTINPSVLIAHNGSSFDLPYMHFCANQMGSSLDIGRDGSALQFDSWESKFRKDQSQSFGYKKPRIYGREFIDTLFLSVKYDISKKYESYRLKTIIAQEGLEKVGRAFYDASLIRVNYKIPEEWKKIKLYCIDDSDDSLALYDLMGPSFFYLAQSVSKPFQLVNESATGSMINNIMVRAYLQDKHSIPKADTVHRFKGAISFGRPGIYRNTLKWDVASLYPSIMVEYKIHSKIKDPKGYFLTLVKTLREQRLLNKKIAKETDSKYHNDLQESQKITINSCYGFLGTNGLNFNYPLGAEEITRLGRDILKTAILKMTGEEYIEIHEEIVPLEPEVENETW
jgi:DNA polymerase I